MNKKTSPSDPPRNQAGLLGPYSSEDEWLDQLDSLPTEEQLEQLVGMMRVSELREYAQGMTRDAVAACKMGDLLEVTRVINGWVATAEELVTHRRNLRFIQAARSRK